MKGKLELKMKLGDEDNDLMLYADDIVFEMLDGELSQATVERLTKEIQYKFCQLLMTRFIKLEERKEIYD